MTTNEMSPMATAKVRKEYAVEINLGKEVINISAYSKEYAEKTARNVIAEAYGDDISLEADYEVREIV
jgi:hypothetical protein